MSDPVASFDGAKIAILRRAEVLTLLRDDIPTIPSPNMWDLPGGGREGNETPFETAARELLEELSVEIDARKVIHHREYTSASNPSARVHFFVARWDDLPDAGIVLGDEGQCWKWMPMSAFIANEKAVPSLRERLKNAATELAIPL
jgi:8-oxo-dGTP diphosphatase